MHHVDRDTPWDEIWEAMEMLRQQGKIIYVGSSNFAGWHIAQAQEAAHRPATSLGLVSEQSIYNLLSRWVELEVLPAAQHYGLGVIPWSPLHGGLLGGVLRKQREGGGIRGSRPGRPPSCSRSTATRIEAYEKLCAELGEDPADVGLAWLLHQPGVTAPIIGPRTVEQLDGSLRALEIKLDDETLARLDETLPRPARTARSPPPRPTPGRRAGSAEQLPHPDGRVGRAGEPDALEVAAAPGERVAHLLRHERRVHPLPVAGADVDELVGFVGRVGRLVAAAAGHPAEVERPVEAGPHEAPLRNRAEPVEPGVVTLALAPAYADHPVGQRPRRAHRCAVGVHALPASHPVGCG